MRQNSIKFRPNRPRSPHLNGKVERSQRTDRMEFWATIDTTAPPSALEKHLLEWQRFYNQERTLWHRQQDSACPLARSAGARANARSGAGSLCTLGALPY